MTTSDVLDNDNINPSAESTPLRRFGSLSLDRPKSISIPRTPNQRRNSDHLKFSSPKKNTIKSPNLLYAPAQSPPYSSPIRGGSPSGFSPSRSYRNSPCRDSSKDLSSGTIKGNGIKVITRFRPEANKVPSNVIDFQSETSISYNLNETQALFTFDRIFGPEATQQEVFDYSVNETVSDVFQGYNGTILAYGQTGSGKTYTMMGDIEDEKQRGLIPRIAESIFTIIMESPCDIEYTVGVSYMEIYMEKIKDLLVPDSNHLSIHEDKVSGVYVKGLQCIYVTTQEELNSIMTRGSESRLIGSTNMNLESSRSHAIFQVEIKQKQLDTGVTKKGNLFLVDLAGSEKVARTGASGQTLEEAKKINSSLSALGNVIYALTDGKSQHIPYRDSKLTRILQESLGGNSRTSLIINCSPDKKDSFETLSTLRFGARAKKIKNKAHINSELSSSELKHIVTKLEFEKLQQSSYIKRLELELRNGPLEKSGTSEIEYIKAQLDMEKLANASLINDINEKNIKGSELELEVETLKSQLRKRLLSRGERQRILALERTLEQFALKLEEMVLQNSILKSDIATTRRIAETRNERIRMLEGMVKEQQTQVQKESSNFEDKLALLRERLYDVKKIGKGDLYNTPEHRSSLKFDSFSRSYLGEDGFDESEENVALDQSPVISRSEFGSPDMSGKKGLNLRIVKPLRGGGGSKEEIRNVSGELRRLKKNELESHEAVTR